MTTFNESNLEAPPEDLCSINGIAGILLLEEGRIIINNFPLNPAQTARLAGVARKMCAGFRKARRILRQVIIGYPCGQLIVTSHDNCQLVLLLLEESSLDQVSEAGSAYLTKRTNKPLRLPRAGSPQAS